MRVAWLARLTAPRYGSTVASNVVSWKRRCIRQRSWANVAGDAASGFASCQYSNVVPSEFTNFFLGSVGASATLIGLLFIAVAIEPKRVFGSEATADRQAIATGAFTALGNVFFISLGALIPDKNLGSFILAVGAFALLNTLGLSRRLWRGRLGGRQIRRGAGLVVASFIIYGLELWYGWSLLHAPAEAGYISSLTILLCGAYGIALGRAWELLGARNWGLLAWLMPPQEEEQDDSRSYTPSGGGTAHLDRQPSDRDS
jgi:hypothetical protein